MKYASTALVIDPWNKDTVLCVTRKDGTIGLPGGKLEDGESFVDCAIRELEEETGLVTKTVSHLIHHGFDEDGYMVTTYLVIPTHYRIEQREGGTVSWLSPKRILENTIYKEYNKTVFKKAGFSDVED